MLLEGKLYFCSSSRTEVIMFITCWIERIIMYGLMDRSINICGMVVTLLHFKEPMCSRMSLLHIHILRLIDNENNF